MCLIYGSRGYDCSLWQGIKSQQADPAGLCYIYFSDYFCGKTFWLGRWKTLYDLIVNFTCLFMLEDLIMGF